MSETILVTGGCGFIGSNFVHRWRREHPADRVIVLDKLTYAADPGQLQGLEEVELVLQKLAAREDGALTQKLAASPGMKEPRWAQTLGGPVEFIAPAVREAGGSDRLTALEAEVAKLREEVAELRRRLDEVL